MGKGKPGEKAKLAPRTPEAVRAVRDTPSKSPGDKKTIDLTEQSLEVIFEHLAKRPHMLTGYGSFQCVWAYLKGLRHGLQFMGVDYTLRDYGTAAKSRGWDHRGASGIRRDFELHSLSDDEKASELVAVERDAYVRALKRLGKTLAEVKVPGESPYA